MTSVVATNARRGLLLAAFASGVVTSTPARAQTTCPPSAIAASRSWSTPLDRRIALQARDVSLRDGLDRLAAAAGFRLSYSAELLPLDRHVCVATESVIVGEALLQLLAGTGVEAIATGPDQVVLTPRRATQPDDVVTAVVQTLDRVVVTGSATGNAERPLSVAIDVLDGARLRERAATNLSQTFDGSVPGLWIWDQSPTSVIAKYGSIRGASSFGLSYPKIYIDGIEVANPSLMVEMNPSMVDHVEVIRGPQGAALYGADAISGVVNIVTRNEGTQAGAERADVTTGAGLSQTSYTAKPVFTQSHALTWRGGSSVRSGTVAISATTLGDYVPGAYSRDLKINAAGRTVASWANFTGSARFYGKEAAIGENPLVKSFASVGSTRREGGALYAVGPDSVPPLLDDSLPESIHEYTVGGTATIFTSGRWTPSVVAGIDGYRLANVPNDFEPLPPALDQALNAARAGGDRGTVKASVVGQFGDLEHRSLALTFAAEQSTIRESQDTVAQSSSAVWRSNSGLTGQANLALENRVYVTGGLRLERNDGFTSVVRTDLLPMIGMAVVKDYGENTLKLRLAYGNGIRPAQAALRLLTRDGMRGPAAPTLEPEQQSGTEMGIDFLVQHQFGVHVTRFDQTAYNLIQPVMLAVPDDGRSGSGGSGSGSGSGSGRQQQFQYTLQNVGQIANSGWELESTEDLGPLSVKGSLSLVDSRVLQIARNYVGDLRLGDRMLGVPARTTGLAATWHQRHWRISGGLTRASDWINYDRLKLAQDFAGSALTAEQIVKELRNNYWLHYDGVTRLHASFSRDLTSGLSLALSGDNLTNVQRGEPDNITVLPGRTVMLGLTAKIR